MTTAVVPPAVEVPQTADDDPRVGHLIGRKVADGADPAVVIVGFPTDQGVRRNGGRPGAADSPTEIRRWLYRLTPDAERYWDFYELLGRTQDLGDLVTGSDLEADQERLGELVAPHLEEGRFVVVLGGGHETAFGHFLGYVKAGKTVSLVNIDAHADVRPLKDGLGHSGSPFRQALEHPSGGAADYRVLGLLPQSVAADHLEFLAQKRRPPREGPGFLFRRDVQPETLRRLFSSLRPPTLASFDIDAVDQSQAPGVSAPATAGLSADVWLMAAYESGRSPAVTSFDIVELNPQFDRDGQTARLAALTVWTVLRGLIDRKDAGTARRPPRRARRLKRLIGL